MTLSALLKEISRLKQVNGELAYNNEQLKSKLEENEQIMLEAMLSVTEIYETMLASQPLLSPEEEEVVVPISDVMIQVYVTLILKNKKTLDEIPSVIRSQIEAKMQENENAKQGEEK